MSVLTLGTNMNVLATSRLHCRAAGVGDHHEMINWHG